MPAPIDRTHPVLRAGPVISKLTDEEVWALTGLMARLAASVVRRRIAEQHQPDDDTSRQEVAS